MVRWNLRHLPLCITALAFAFPGAVHICAGVKSLLPWRIERMCRFLFIECISPPNLQAQPFSYRGRLFWALLAKWWLMAQDEETIPAKTKDYKEEGKDKEMK